MTRYTQEQRWDHQRDLQKHEPHPRHQRRAVVELVGYMHGLMVGGHFSNSPEVEKALRGKVNNLCREFELDTLPAPKVPA